MDGHAGAGCLVSEEVKRVLGRYEEQESEEKGAIDEAVNELVKSYFFEGVFLKDDESKELGACLKRF